MAEDVYLHIGLPKTATTYLQTIVWSHRAELEDQGFRLPGEHRRDHYWSTRIVREEEQFRLVSNAHRLGAWDRVVADTATWSGTALISHEFFAAATAEQATRMIEALAPATVHVVVTAREPLSLFTASWQESIKNRDVRTLEEYAEGRTGESTGIWNWNTLDLRLVLERWSQAVPPERVHVLPLPPPSAPRSLVWERFATLVGIDPSSVDVGVSFPNTSMGVVEAETLRRINRHLDDFWTAIDRGTYIRTYLADERLVPRGGERFWPTPDRIAEIRERGRRAVEYVADAGFDVIGDLDSLRVPDELPERRTPESVTDDEVVEVATELVARMLADVRALRHERRDLRAELAASRQMEDPGLRVAVSRKFPLLGRVLMRGRTDPGTGYDAPPAVRE
jgi:hypothetical protein